MSIKTVFHTIYSNCKILKFSIFTCRINMIKTLLIKVKISRVSQLGVVACSCNPATWRSGSENGLRAGVLLSDVLCRSGVRTKLGINMVLSGEPRRSRLSKEERIGPGWKHSRQKFPCRAVVG